MDAGHLNHSMFWEMLCPPGSSEPPQGKLMDMIERDFGSLDTMISTFNGKTAAVQGSGWGWLGYNTESDSLVVATTANQDPLQATTGLIPLLGIDVWEHAYVRVFYGQLALCAITYMHCVAVSSIQECSPRLSQGNLEGCQLEQCLRSIERCIVLKIYLMHYVLKSPRVRRVNDSFVGGFFRPRTTNNVMHVPLSTCHTDTFHFSDMWFSSTC